MKRLLMLLAVFALTSLAPASASRAQDMGNWNYDCDDWSCYVYNNFTISGSGNYQFYYDIVWGAGGVMKFDSSGDSDTLYGAVVTIDNDRRFELNECDEYGCEILDDGDLEYAVYWGGSMIIQVNDGSGWYSHTLSLYGSDAAMDLFWED